MPTYKFSKISTASVYENYKTLLYGIKQDLNKWRDILYSCIRRLSLGKMSFLLKSPYRFKEIHIKIPAGLFIAIYNMMLKFILQSKGTRIVRKRN